MMKLIIRPLGLDAFAPPCRPLVGFRSYATHHGLGTRASSSGPRTKAVTPFNDSGQIPWHELSTSEKTARATQQSFNFGLVVLGIVMTGGVGYFLYQDVFSSDSKTAFFNRTFDRIRKDPECLALLGDGKKILAHGEETTNKWRRARPIASTHKVDGYGNEHLMLNFYVEGPLNRGTVSVHMIKRAGSSEYEYKYLFLDVPGHPRIYLENADTKSASEHKKYRLFGVDWS